MKVYEVPSADSERAVRSFCKRGHCHDDAEEIVQRAAVKVARYGMDGFEYSRFYCWCLQAEGDLLRSRCPGHHHRGTVKCASVLWRDGTKERVWAKIAAQTPGIESARKELGT